MKYNFREAGRFDRSYQKFANSVSHLELALVYRSMAENIRRVECLQFLAPLSFFFSQFTYSWLARASLELTGHLPDKLAGEKEELSSKIGNRMNELKTGWLKQWAGAENDLFEEVYKQGNALLDEMLSQDPGYFFGPGIEAVLSSMLLGAWTIFESFATDAWVVALNANPKLAYYASKTAGRKTKDDAESVDNDEGKSVTVELVDEYDYDLRGKMGFILKASKKFNFNRHRGIAAAYACTFGKDASNVFDDPKYRRLVVLEGIRNVIAHSGGRIDAQFKDRAKKRPSEYGSLANLKIGDLLPLDGSMAKEFMNLAIDACCALMPIVERAIIREHVPGTVDLRKDTGACET
jgi:hypothetical protein